MFLRWGLAAICLAMFQRLAQQPPAVQLQKGLYSQNAAGNLDAAIQKYRQILASNPSKRPVAAQAQYRLAQALLQKGDLSGAAQEFQNLAVNYPESKDLIRALAMGGVGSGTQEIGTFENGRFHHTLTGIEFNAPVGWNLTFQGASSGDGKSWSSRIRRPAYRCLPG